MAWQKKFQTAMEHQKSGRLEAAERFYRATIRDNPGFAAAHHNLGTVLQQLGRFRHAVHALEMSAKLDPELAGPARLGIGVVLTRMGDYARAETELRAAIEAAPGTYEPHRFLGDLLRTEGRMEEARRAYLEALRIHPKDAEARFGLASVRLALGEMPDAWDDYESRASRLSTPALQPIWSGEEIAGRTVLVHSEQGLGDAIQFLRYVPLLAERKARVLLAVRQEIMALASSVEGAAGIVEPSYTLPRFDISIGLPSLPRMFRTTLDAVPGKVPYLRADAAKVAAWRARLGEGRIVAVAWRGNPQHRNDHRRSIVDGAIVPLLEIQGPRFVVIQKDDGDAPKGAIRCGSESLDDIAAILAVADLTISVDTVFCHMAGALGRPVWTLLSTAPDWRWGLEGTSTPWYPTMRLFRQGSSGDWQGVVRDVAAELRRAMLSPDGGTPWT